MPSSTSSSKQPRLRAWAVILVVCCVATAAVIECASSVMLRNGRTSQRLRRQLTGIADFGIRETADGTGRRVLLVGNSLLADDTDEELLVRSTRPEIELRPLFLEATAYYDWYYGLRRLMRRGIAPDVVA